MSGFISLPMIDSLDIAWSPPSDWIDISSVGNNETNFLVGDFSTQYIEFKVTTASSTDYTVDWGDSNIETFAHNTTAWHSYSGSTGGTPCSEGYNTYKVVISSTGSTPTFIDDLDQTYVTNVYNGNCILDVNCNFTGMTAGTLIFKNCINTRRILFPTVMDSAGQCQGMLENCRALEEVRFPTSMQSASYMGYLTNGCSSLKKITLPYNLPSLTNLTYAFQNTYSLEKIVFPSNLSGVTNMTRTFNTSGIKEVNLPALPEVLTMDYCFNTCRSLHTLTFTSLPKATTLYQGIINCSSLGTLVLPEMPAMVSIGYLAQSCTSLHFVSFSGSLDTVTIANNAFATCNNLINITLPTSMTAATTTDYMFGNCYSIDNITLPTGMRSVTDCDNMFLNTHSLKEISNVDQLGRTGNTVTMDNFCNTVSLISGLTFNAFFSKIDVNGCTNLPSLRLLNSGSTFGGASPQVDVGSTGLDQAALVDLFNDIPTVVGGQVINITSAAGAGDLSVPERAIATDKGWTITG